MPRQYLSTDPNAGLEKSAPPAPSSRTYVSTDPNAGLDETKADAPPAAVKPRQRGQLPTDLMGLIGMLSRNKTAQDAVIDNAGTIGGVVGATRGGIPGAVAGGMVGAGAQHLLRGESPVSLDVPLEGVKQGVYVLGGRGLEKGGQAVAERLYRTALRPTFDAMKAAGTDLVKYGLGKGVPVTQKAALALDKAQQAARAGGAQPTAASEQLVKSIARVTNPKDFTQSSIPGFVLETLRSPGAFSRAGIRLSRAAPSMVQGGANAARTLEMLVRAAMTDQLGSEP